MRPQNGTGGGEQIDSSTNALPRNALRQMAPDSPTIKVARLAAVAWASGGGSLLIRLRCQAAALQRALGLFPTRIHFAAGGTSHSKALKGRTRSA